MIDMLIAGVLAIVWLTAIAALVAHQGADDHLGPGTGGAST